LIDLCHLDEAGFAMTQPTNYSWFPKGTRLTVPYEANQGRRVNVIGAYFSHGPHAGRFVFETRVNLPQSRAKRPRKTAEERARAHGVNPEDVGKIDADSFLSFVWKLAGRPADASEGWERERPLALSLDNYSVHKSDRVEEEKPALEAANIHLCYLPSYTPELSDIEPVWQDVKHHELTKRSHDQLGALHREVCSALQKKAAKLHDAHQSCQLPCGTT
jgi:hypothetical protein